MFEVGSGSIIKDLGLIFPDTGVRVPGLALGPGFRSTVIGSEVGV